MISSCRCMRKSYLVILLSAISLLSCSQTTQNTSETHTATDIVQNTSIQWDLYVKKYKTSYKRTEDGRYLCKEDTCECAGKTITLGSTCYPSYALYVQMIQHELKELEASSDFPKEDLPKEEPDNQKHHKKTIIKSKPRTPIPPQKPKPKRWLYRMRYGINSKTMMRVLEPCDQTLCLIEPDDYVHSAMWYRQIMKKAFESSTSNYNYIPKMNAGIQRSLSNPLEFYACGDNQIMYASPSKLNYLDFGPDNIEQYACEFIFTKKDKKENNTDDLKKLFEKDASLMDHKAWICKKDKCTCGDEQINQGESCITKYIPRVWECSEIDQCEQTFEIKRFRGCGKDIANFDIQDYACIDNQWTCTKDSCDCAGWTIRKNESCYCTEFNYITGKCTYSCSDNKCVDKASSKPKLRQQCEIDDILDTPDYFQNVIPNYKDYQCVAHHWICKNETCDCGGLSVKKGQACHCEYANFKTQSCAKACIADFSRYTQAKDKFTPPKSFKRSDYEKVKLGIKPDILCSNHIGFSFVPQDQLPFEEENFNLYNSEKHIDAFVCNNENGCVCNHNLCEYEKFCTKDGCRSKYDTP